MHDPSKIILAAVAFVSTARVATAAPALGFGNYTRPDNQTFAIQIYRTCAQDSQCAFGSFCDNPAGRCTLGCRADSYCAHDQRCQDGGCVMMTTETACRQNDDLCKVNTDCCSGKCRRELIIFGSLRCVPAK
ncbi:hypothetical protein BJY01DRAFT_252348 [Aspergillus pseudoustus]|uniref:Uncharacterized protein n=1 Tax=Aspergillus pseudoustus TaxID=1810923 RepID=A0ABR4J6U1_9EURO